MMTHNHLNSSDGSDSGDRGPDRAGALESDEAIELWRWLLSAAGNELCERAAKVMDTGSRRSSHDVAGVAGLRRKWSAAQVRAAMQLVEARGRAADKFPGSVSRLACDPSGVEQATGFPVARWKAGRLAAMVAGSSAAGSSSDTGTGSESNLNGGDGLGRVVLDLCCGVGLDAMAFVDAGLTVTGVDREPLRAWMTQHNAGCQVVAADVETIDVTSRWVHLDPARRDEGTDRRRHGYEDYLPGPSVINRIIGQAAGGMIKLGPGIDLTDLSQLTLAEVERLTELVFISDGGALRQAVLLFGGDVVEGVSRRAVTLPSGQELAGEVCESWNLPIGSLRRFVMTIDPAVERAELSGQLAAKFDAVLPDADAGLLTTDEPIDSPWGRSYEVVAEMPFREARVSRWLKEHQAGVVTVKTRAKAADADSLQRKWRGKGDAAWTVFLQRWGRRVIAIIAKPV